MVKIKSVLKVTDKNHLKPKPISKLLKAIFYVALFLFSMDFGLIKYKSFKEKITVKIFVLVATPILGITFLVTSYYGNMELQYFIWSSIYLAETYAHILILLFTPANKTFCSYLNHLHSIDASIGVNSNAFKLDIKILIYSVTAISYKIVTSVLYCLDPNECPKPIWVTILYLLTYVSMDIPLILFFFIFYAARSRLVVLRQLVEERQCEPKHFQYLYISLLDSTQTVKKAFDPIFFISLLSDVPCIMAIIYEIIKEIKVGSTMPMTHAMDSTFVLLSIIVFFAPTVVAGSLSNEVNRIKISFRNMLLEENDPEEERDIKKLINYVDARPFKFKLLGIIPMDSTFPMKVLNICVTYIIVLLQLTHLY